MTTKKPSPIYCDACRLEPGRRRRNRAVVTTTTDHPLGTLTMTITKGWCAQHLPEEHSDD